MVGKMVTGLVRRSNYSLIESTRLGRHATLATISGNWVGFGCCNDDGELCRNQLFVDFKCSDEQIHDDYFVGADDTIAIDPS